MNLCYTALSPFCRKVRMVLDHMGVPYEVTDSCDIRKHPAFSPRAEIPILQDGDVTVRNSATIVDYLTKRFPDAPSPFPESASDFALAKEWEIVADTMHDPIITNVAIFVWGDLPPAPDGLMEAARTDIRAIYKRLDKALAGRDYPAGRLSIADFALFPQIHAAQNLGLAFDKETQAHVARWYASLLNHPMMRNDLGHVMRWWKDRANQDVETDRINWGTYRLEWFLAHGFHDFFMNEVERGAVIWSVGANNNAMNSPLYRMAS